MGKKVKVEKIWDKQSSKTLEPLKIHFEHAGFDVNKAGRDLNKYFTGHLFSGSSSEKGQQNRKQVVALQNDSMVYIGSTHGQHTSQMLTSGSMNTYIGIKKGNKLCLYAATPVTVSPFVKEHTYIKEQDKDMSFQPTLQERREANSNLVKTFGSKKKKRFLMRRENNTVVDMNDSIMSAAAEVKDTQMPETDIVDEAIQNIIPPCNRDALNVSEVYKLNDLLSAQDMEELEAYAIACLDSSSEDIEYWKENETFSDYFFAKYASLSFRPSDPQNIHCMKITLYCEILIRLFKLGHHDIRKKIPSFPDVYPSSLVKKAFDTFTTVNALNVRIRSDEMKDKICCHIMVLVLLSNGYDFDIQLMSTIFQIHIKKLLTLARAVGITVKYHSAAKSYAAQLKIPLPKQIEKRGVHKRRLHS